MKANLISIARCVSYVAGALSGCGAPQRSGAGTAAADLAGPSYAQEQCMRPYAAPAGHLPLPATYFGKAPDHTLVAVTAAPSSEPRTARLLVDGDIRIDLTRVARSYCGASPGLFADVLELQNAHVVVALDAGASGNTVEVHELDLDHASGVRLEGVLSQQRTPRVPSNRMYTLRANGTNRPFNVRVPHAMQAFVTTASHRGLVVEVDGAFMMMSTGGDTSERVLAPNHIEPVPD